MIDNRPITYVRFKTPVTIGAEVMEWAADRPFSTMFAGAIKPRPGDPDRGEPRDSIIFEVRIGKPEAHVDVEVPRAHIAQINRAALPVVDKATVLAAAGVKR